MYRRSIAVALVSLCAVVLFSACTFATTTTAAPFVLGALTALPVESGVVAHT